MSEENRVWYRRGYEQAKRDFEKKLQELNSERGFDIKSENDNSLDSEDVAHMDYYRYEPSVPKTMINCDGQYGFNLCSPRFKVNPINGNLSIGPFENE